MAGNNIRCAAKYLFDKGIVPRERMTLEMDGRLHALEVYLRDGLVSSVSVDMGRASFDAARIPVCIDRPEAVDVPLPIGGRNDRVTCVSVGNPHCVVFTDAIDAIDLPAVGPLFEHAPCFPDRINTEFVRVINRTTLRLRVWERGNGETLACGTGACAAVAAAVRNGYCDAGKDILVKLPGGDLTVREEDGGMTLSGETVMVFEGESIC